MKRRDLIKELENMGCIMIRHGSKQDGFIITAYFTTKVNLERETIIWEKLS